mmetsp:Transcript_19641/g.54783  ORF Transcript_19641/g.54783 Transcript_19641/m.54783 type:complete len:367 (-) Transcript_19641:789-1889(-)
MSLESSPYLPIRVSLNSNTGVSMDTAPWRLNTLVMILKAASRIAIWSGMKSRAPLATLGFRRAWLASTQLRSSTIIWSSTAECRGSNAAVTAARLWGPRQSAAKLATAGGSAGVTGSTDPGPPAAAPSTNALTRAVPLPNTTPPAPFLSFFLSPPFLLSAPLPAFASCGVGSAAGAAGAGGPSSIRSTATPAKLSSAMAASVARSAASAARAAVREGLQEGSCSSREPTESSSCWALCRLDSTCAKAASICSAAAGALCRTRRARVRASRAAKPTNARPSSSKAGAREGATTLPGRLAFGGSASLCTSGRTKAYAEARASATDPRRCATALKASPRLSLSPAFIKPTRLLPSNKLRSSSATAAAPL